VIRLLQGLGVIARGRRPLGVIARGRRPRSNPTGILMTAAMLAPPAALAQPSVVSGLVFDSLRMAPLAGVTVQLSRNALRDPYRRRWPLSAGDPASRAPYAHSDRASARPAAGDHQRRRRAGCRRRGAILQRRFSCRRKLLIPRLQQLGLGTWDGTPSKELATVIETLAMECRVSEQALVLRIGNLLHNDERY
jgi:hypothetical protein